jgi:hypothetical protein
MPVELEIKRIVFGKLCKSVARLSRPDVATVCIELQGTMSTNISMKIFC